MFDNNSKLYRNTIIAFASIIIITLVIFLLIIPFIQYLGRPAFLDVLVAPVDAEITVNGENYHNAVYELEPGTYVADISREGFNSETIEFNLEKNKTTGLYLYLEPTNGDWGFYAQRKNQESLYTLLRLKGYNDSGEIWEPSLQLSKENNHVDSFVKDFTIKSVLPMNFSICSEPASRMTCNAAKVEYNYSKECDNNLCLIITGRSSELTDNMRTEIKNGLSEYGYDLDNYKYVYQQNTEM